MYRLIPFFLISFQLNSQEVILNSKKKSQTLRLRIIKVIPETLDTIKLVNWNKKEMIMKCSLNPFYGNKESVISYTNFYNIEVAHFKFPIKTHCHELKELLYATFEQINEEFPILIDLDTQKISIKTIWLPDIDAYEDGERFLKPKKKEGPKVEEPRA